MAWHHNACTPHMTSPKHDSFLGSRYRQQCRLSRIHQALSSLFSVSDTKIYTSVDRFYPSNAIPRLGIQDNPLIDFRNGERSNNLFVDASALSYRY